MMSYGAARERKRAAAQLAARRMAHPWARVARVSEVGGAGD